MRGFVIGIVILLAGMVASCGGGSSSDGGWLGTSPQSALYLHLSGNGGSADYAYTLGAGSIQTDHDDFVKVNDDQTISLSLTAWGGGCLPSCPYTIKENTMTITGVGMNHNTWTLDRANVSDFEQARTHLSGSPSSG
jgi:hypothetical protein